METLEIRIANMNLQVSVDTQNCLDVMEFSNLLESFFFNLFETLKKYMKIVHMLKKLSPQNWTK